MKNLKQSNIPLEADDGANLAVFLQYMQNLGKIELFSHIPHETYTKSFTAKMRNKRQGVKRGVPDYIIVTRNTILFIELKRQKGGTVSLEQHAWITALGGKQTIATICYGYDAAREFIEKHLV